MEQACKELAPLGEETTITKGPLIMKTRGKMKGAAKDSIWYPHSLQVASKYAFLHQILDAAYTRLLKDDPDFSMRLGGD